MAVTADQIEARLQAQLHPARLRVQDDSDAHAGHAGAGEGSHFSVHIASAAFAGLSRVACHRLVYDALRPLMNEGIHALAVHPEVPASQG